jgi:hypothetical protein
VVTSGIPLHKRAFWRSYHSRTSMPLDSRYIKSVKFAILSEAQALVDYVASMGDILSQLQQFNCRFSFSGT